MRESSKLPPVVPSDADRRLLWFLAEHRMVLDRQMAVHLERPVKTLDERLNELQKAKCLTRFGGWGNSHCCRIRQAGLTAIGSELRAPKPNAGAFWHDVGVAWLWLLAHRGAFGPLADVMGERRLRAEDMAAPDRPHSIRLGGYDHKGNPRRHYPDLLLVDPGGRRLALELELSTKGVARREAILAGYGAARRIDGVVYFVERNHAGQAVGRAIEVSAAEMGVSDRVHLRTVPPIRPGASEAAEARPARRRLQRTGVEAGR